MFHKVIFGFSIVLFSNICVGSVGSGLSVSLAIFKRFNVSFCAIIFIPAGNK